MADNDSLVVRETPRGLFLYTTYFKSPSIGFDDFDDESKIMKFEVILNQQPTSKTLELPKFNELYKVQDVVMNENFATT